MCRFRGEESEEWGPVPGVKMVVVDRDGDVVKEVQGLGSSEDRKQWTEILKSFVVEAPVTLTVKSKRSQEASAVSENSLKSNKQKDVVGDKMILDLLDLVCRFINQIWRGPSNTRS